MKRSWMAILLATSFVSSPLLAADGRYCDNYAKTSIKQQFTNIVKSCRQQGIRWSSLYQGQYDWCRTVRIKFADNETRIRNQALQNCGTSLDEKAWEKTENTSAATWLYLSMQAAAKKDDLTAVKYMQSLGVVTSDPGGDNDGGLLYIAVESQAERVSKYLLSIGKNPKQIPNGGGNALAAMLNNKKVNYRMLGMLLRNGFDPNYGGEGYSDSYFPVLQAAIKNDYQAMLMLLKAGGDPNVSRDSTPLIYAIRNRNMSIVRALLGAGADVNASIPDNFCEKALDAAVRSGSASLVNTLKSKGAKSAGC